MVWKRERRSEFARAASATWISIWDGETSGVLLALYAPFLLLVSALAMCFGSVGGAWMLMLISWCLVSARKLVADGRFRVICQLPVSTESCASLVWMIFVVFPTVIVGFGGFAAAIVGKLAPFDVLLSSIEMFLVAAVVVLAMCLVLPFKGRWHFHALVAASVCLVLSFILFLVKPAAGSAPWPKIALHLVAFVAAAISFSLRNRFFFILANPNASVFKRRVSVRRIRFRPRFLERAREYAGHNLKWLPLLGFYAIMFRGCSSTHKGHATVDPMGEYVFKAFFTYLFLWLPLSMAYDEGIKAHLKIYRSLPLSNRRILLLLNVRNLLFFSACVLPVIVFTVREDPSARFAVLKFMLLSYGLSTLIRWLELRTPGTATIVAVAGIVAIFMITMLWQLKLLDFNADKSPLAGFKRMIDSTPLWPIAGVAMSVLGLWLQYAEILRGDVFQRAGTQPRNVAAD